MKFNDTLVVNMVEGQDVQRFPLCLPNNCSMHREFEKPVDIPALFDGEFTKFWCQIDQMNVENIGGTVCVWLYCLTSIIQGRESQYFEMHLEISNETMREMRWITINMIPGVCFVLRRKLLNPGRFLYYATLV